ncbi:hypothetical protein ACFPYM_19005, partial [Methylobacterium hispanicum]
RPHRHLPTIRGLPPWIGHGGRVPSGQGMGRNGAAGAFLPSRVHTSVHRRFREVVKECLAGP